MNSRDDDLVGIDTRLHNLCGDGETLLGYLRASGTEEGVYYLTMRSWPHPTVDDATTLALRYAYLTRGSGGDGWVGGDSDAAGINMRVEGDPAEFARAVAKMSLGASKRLDSDDDHGPWMGRLED